MAELLVTCCHAALPACSQTWNSSSGSLVAGKMAALDLQAERDKIQQEIEVLERSLGCRVSGDVDLSDSSDDDLEDQDGDLEADDVIWEDGGSEAEMCLQMNLVYQSVIQEKLQEVEILITQNKEQQEELLWELAGRKTQRPGATKPYPMNLSIGHFLKPYFKDKVSGLGPPANQEMISRQAHTVRSFKDLASRKWRSSDGSELRMAIINDSQQRLLEPKLLKLDYLQRKRDATKSDIDKKILTKQIQETEREMDEINQMSEEALLGRRTDDHDWAKISNINFEGIHSAERLCRMWQNYEHPDVSKEKWSEEEIKNLQEIAEQNNYVNWEEIAEELGTKRTAFQCLQTFQNHNKAFKRKEFTKEEDEMLMEFVQRMRIGEHIPFLKISYFMEGRDGFQIGYRWTKSLDPSLKKGQWSKEEDQMLLKAVAKYGEKDWYKIRLEVPGRSDVQCRERYVKGLHKDLKKGKWSPDERDKLVELTAKYGVGHWSKVSSELPHRTASQCLSKWKIINGYFRNRVRPSQKRLQETSGVRKTAVPSQKKKKEDLEDDELSISSSSSSSNSSSSDSSSDSSFVMSSSESEDEEIELIDPEEEEISGLLHSVPSLELWVPKNSPDSRGKTLLVQSTSGKAKQGTSKISKKNKTGNFQFNTVLKGIAFPPSSDSVTENVEDLLQEAEENGRQILYILEDDVRKVLIRNTKASAMKQIQRAKQRQSKSMPKSDQREDSTSSLLRDTMSGLYRASVDRKLLFAVSPWVGNVFLPVSSGCRKPLRSRTWADEMNKKLSKLNITSTPIFTLIIQFFQIDADGCLQMINQRKAEQTASFRGVKGCTMNTLRGITQSNPMSSKDGAAAQSYKKQPRRRRNYEPKRRHPFEKPKTVSELLKEKRMKQSTNSISAQNKTSLPSKVFIGPGIVIQQLPSSPVRTQTVVLPLAPVAAQNNAQPPKPFSPMPAGQVAATNIIPASRMSPTAKHSAQSTEPVSLKPADQMPAKNNMAACLMSPINAQNSDRTVRPFSPKPVGQEVARKTLSAYLMSPTGGRNEPAPLLGAAQQPSPGRLLVRAAQPSIQSQGSVMLFPQVLHPAQNRGASPITFILTSQGLIPIQVLAQSTQQMVNQSSGVVNTPSSNLAKDASVSPLPLGRETNVLVRQPLVSGTIPAVSDASCPSPAISSPSRQKDAPPNFPVVSSPQGADAKSSMLAPSDSSNMPLQTLHAFTTLGHAATAATSSAISHMQQKSPCLPILAPSSVPANPLLSLIASCPQDGSLDLPLLAPSDAAQTPPHSEAVISSSMKKEDSSVISYPQLACLTTVSPFNKASHNSSTVSSPLKNKDQTLTSSVNKTQGLGSNLPLPMALVASSTPSPKTPSGRSTLIQVDTATESPAGSSSQLAGPCVPVIASSDASDMASPMLLTVRRPNDPANTSSILSHHEVSRPFLPVLGPASENSHKVASTLGQEGNAVPSPVVSCTQVAEPSLPRCTIVAGLPNKESQARLTPEKYPIVRIAKILSPNQDTVKVASDSPQTPAPSGSNKTSPSSTNADKKTLDVSLISLEDESVVKEWLHGKRPEDVRKGNLILPYLPPSICTLKMLSRLLLQKKSLEENAVKLLPSTDVTEAGFEKNKGSQNREAINIMVEERLKDNVAYQLLKQRFLSMFTIPGFMAVLPPTSAIGKHQDSDDDLTDSEINWDEVAHEEKPVDPAADGDSRGNMPEISEAESSEKGVAVSVSTGDSDSSETIVIRRTAYSRTMT